MSLLNFKIALSVIFCMSAWAVSTAQSWVASTGTVGPVGSKYARFGEPIVYIDSAAPIPTTITLRYNLDHVEESFDPEHECKTLQVRYVDNGNGAHVLVRIKGQDVVTGQVTTLATFDSNLTGEEASNSFQVHGTACIEGDFPLDFVWQHIYGGGGSVYYVVASLTRSATGGNPRLSGMWITVSVP